MDGNAPAKPPAGGIKTFSCPNCGGTVGIRAVGTTVTAVCQSCGSLIDVANDNLRIIEAAAVKVRPSLIPLGARGTLFGTEWEAIGYSVRTDDSGEYDWREYLLFNPYQGFRFLTEADGHWNFVKMLRKTVEAGEFSENLHFEGDDYRLFVRGGAVVEYVMGEFYWRVKVGEKTGAADYVSSPYMLSCEKSDQDIVWSQGIYVEAEAIGAAFKVADMPAPKGVAPNQPSPFAETMKSIKLLAVFFFIALVVVQAVAVKTAPNRVVYQKQMHVFPASKGQLVIADPVEIPGDIGNIEIIAYAPVQNNWVELDISLVNDATQESDDIIRPIEYYSGYDSDGHWSEGSQLSSALLSGVAGGKYHLLVEPDAGAFARGQPVDFTIQVVRGAPMWGNFWIILLLLLAYPLFIMMRGWSFEAKRWAGSDYAPAKYRKQQR